MLGFRQAIFPAGEYVSDWVADVKKGLNSLYVYCPLVEPRMVGDAQVPLLRILPVERRVGEMITRVFDPIQSCPLLQRRFQTVKIDIRDDTGSIVPIERAAMPLLKKGAKTLGSKALKTGLHIAGDVVKGRNIKQAAKSRLKSTGQTYSRKQWTR